MPLLTRALLLISLVMVGCTTYRQVASRYPRSDIEAIYQNALPNSERNPVVLIHGFAGAALHRLEDDSTVWGAFFTKNSLLPSKQAGLRAFSLNIDSLAQPVDPASLVSIADDTHAVELLEKVKADAGPMEINVGVYAALVELVESAGYGTCQGDPADIDVTDSPPCLTFFYDWRQDNVGNAIRLGRFLEESRRQIDGQRAAQGVADDEPVLFDVVAHSMGGLVARYFLRYGGQDILADDEASITWAGAKFMDRLVIISTPNFGAMKVLRELIVGRSYPVVKFEPAMLATWVSPYQMLPRSHHAVWLNEQGDLVPGDALSAEVWEQNGWGPFAPGQGKYLAWIFPGEPSPATRRRRITSFMTAAFERARQFAQAMDRRPETSCPTELTLFAADVQPTMARAILRSKDGRRFIRFESTKTLNLKAPGDGSVTRASAVADERLIGESTGFVTSPIPWSRKIFLTDMHRTFLGNPTFQNNLLHILLESPPSREVRQE